MSRSPLEAMIDAACSCVKCGRRGSPGTCGCWVKLECPKCGASKLTERNDFDPPRTVKVRLQCPDCNAGDFDTPAFLDAEGRELSWEDAPAECEASQSGTTGIAQPQSEDTPNAS